MRRSRLVESLRGRQTPPAVAAWTLHPCVPRAGLLAILYQFYLKVHGILPPSRWPGSRRLLSHLP